MPYKPRSRWKTCLARFKHQPLQLWKPALETILVATLGDGVARWIGVGLLAVGVLLSAWQYMRRDDRP